MKLLSTVACLALLLTSCAPKVVLHSTAAASAAGAPTPAEAPFVVVKEDEPFTGPAEELGDLHIKDSGLTLDCEYETVVALASERARQLGANVLRIYEHNLPNPLTSTCHRIRAKALRVADVTPYEREIVWTAARRLRREDFKGSALNRPFEAATSSGIRYHYAGRLLQGNVQLLVETVFSCQDSYFKGSASDDPTQTLAHEQGHFDIAEIGARRFTKLLQEQVGNTRELESKQQALYQQVLSDTQRLHDHYDSEVYADPTKQAGWLATIAQELQALQPYAHKQLTIRIKV